MLIFHLTANCKRGKIPLLSVITAVLFLALCMATFPQTVLAGGVGDVVTEVTHAHFSSAEFNFGVESTTGQNFKMHAGRGNIGNGKGILTVLGPTGASGIKTLLDYIDTETDRTSIHTKKMKGCEVREYTMSNGAGLGVILPDYLITVELYGTGYGDTADIKTALNIAQQTLDGLEHSGLLSQPAPDIKKATEEQPVKTPATVEVEPEYVPILISDTMNSSVVSNGPTVPTTFSINSPHLVTEIFNYHWNSKQGSTPGTIGLQDQNGKMYGPWQAVGTPGQGGVPNANWFVYPNIVIPTGTYTVIDSGPSTWSHNASSGGKGMGHIKATPHLEKTTGGPKDTPVVKKGTPAKSDCTESPAGVGAVGNIPGPSDATEAIVGVAVPGLIASILGALAGLGGGGATPPGAGIPLYPNGAAPLPGTGGTPGAGGRTAGATPVTSQIGRRGKETILVDTADIFENQPPVEGKEIIIDTLPDRDLVASGTPKDGTILDTLHDQDLIDDTGDEILIDTSALEDTMEDKAIPDLKESIYDQDGYDALGYDKKGFDKTGFDQDGYDRSGVGKAGRRRDDGQDKDSFNQDGYDKDSYDRQGFDYKGYNRYGYDPWGYDRQGYDKDGYHWSGYNMDGYDRSGRHWSKLDYDPKRRNPFDGGPVSLDGSPVKDDIPAPPPLGQPYPATADKYAPRDWTDVIPKTTEKPTASTIQGSGATGAEDPWSTLKDHDLGGQTQATPEIQPGSGLPIPEKGVPGVSDIQQGAIPGAPSVTGPQHGDTIILPGKDGRDYTLDYNAKTGEWENILTGGKIRNDDLDSYIKDFNKWQDQVANDQKWSAIELEKMANRQDAHSKAIDQTLDKWKGLDQMQKVAGKYGIGEKGGSGDVDKAIQDLKNDMLAGKDIDDSRVEQLKNIIKNRIEGKTTADSGQRWAEKPWYKDLDSLSTAGIETGREVVTGRDVEGNISWAGLGARIAIGAATGGASEKIFTVVEAMHRIKTAVDSGKDGVEAYTGAAGQTLVDYAAGRVIFSAIGKASKAATDAFPILTKKTSELVEKGMLKIQKPDQLASRELGLVGADSAGNTIKQIEKRIAKLGSAGDVAAGTGKAAKGGAGDVTAGAGKAAKGGGEDLAGAVRKGKTDPGAPKGLDQSARTQTDVLKDPKATAKAKQSLTDKIQNFDKLPDAQKRQLIKDQTLYDKYSMQAEDRNWKLANKVMSGETVSVKDVLEMKADPTSIRKLKDIHQIGGLGKELGDSGAKNVQVKFNETLQTKIYDPAYKDVSKALQGKYGEVKVGTIRTPGKEYHKWDINTDNDIVARHKIVGPDGKVEWKEIPRSEWEDTYFKSYARNTGFDPQDAAKRFPQENWGKMSQTEQYRKWGELHGESPTDVYHPEATRDFSTERTAILGGKAPGQAPAAQATKGQGTLLDSEGLGMMEKNKIDHYWNKGDLRNQTEAMEQLKKASAQAQKLEDGYKAMGYKINDMPDNMQKAIKAIGDNSLSPASRAARLAELGYDSPGDFVEKLTGRIGALKLARK